VKLASYTGTRPGILSLTSILIRWRLRGDYSHNEVVFEPGDGVDHLMPDGTCEPDADGALWCVSSTGLDRIPDWSPARAGRLGGVRFKRIVLDPNRWVLDDTSASPEFAAMWACLNEGMLYDWQFVLGFVAWPIPNKDERVSCSEAGAEMLRFEDAWRFDPCILRAVVASSGRTTECCT
jgi:hypothetical protein